MRRQDLEVGKDYEVAETDGRRRIGTRKGRLVQFSVAPGWAVVLYGPGRSSLVTTRNILRPWTEEA